MMAFEMPANETERLIALRSYNLLDTPSEFAFDELTELAAQICGCPVAFISLIDETRTWLKSKYGLPPAYTEVPRDISICASTLCHGDVLYVPDLTQDARFSDNRLVVGEPHIRFYCGVPLINQQGYALGTFCIVDFAPHPLDPGQVDALRRLAHQAVAQLELRRSLGELNRTMQSLERARAEIAEEKAKSDRLLLNILPESVAQELKDKDRVTPRYYESITIVFTDFSKFTLLAESMEPAQLVDTLDQYFSVFDEIVRRHGLEKVRTIGDAYMCAGGLPEPNRRHPVDACLTALEIQYRVLRMNQGRQRLRLPPWEMRIGLHSGPAVAGVVGRHKFTYDIWGNSVNVASRMEEESAPGRINLSESTYLKVQRFFECTPRGPVEAKNKGPLPMFFLDRLRPEFAADAEGHLANDRLGDECRRLFGG